MAILDEALRRVIEERAHALWEAAGRPEGRAEEFWLLAEQETLTQSVAGEEDPYVALDHEEPGAFATTRGSGEAG
jgi:hypothetical protein